MIEDTSDYISKKVVDGVSNVGGYISDGVQSISKTVSNAFVPQESGDRSTAPAQAPENKLHSEAINGLVSSTTKFIAETTDSVSRNVSGAVANAIHNDMQRQAREAANMTANLQTVDRVNWEAEKRTTSDMFATPNKIDRNSNPVAAESGPYIPKETRPFDYSEIKAAAAAVAFDKPTLSQIISAGAAQPAALAGDSALRGAVTDIVKGGAVVPKTETSNLSNILSNNNPFKSDYKAEPIGANLAPKADATPNHIPDAISKISETPGKAFSDILNRAASEQPANIKPGDLPQINKNEPGRSEMPNAIPAPGKIEAPVAPLPQKPDVSVPNVAPRLETPSPAPATVKVEQPSAPAPGRGDVPAPAPVKVDTPVARTDVPTGGSKTDAPAGTAPGSGTTGGGKIDSVNPGTGKIDGAARIETPSTIPGRTTDGTPAPGGKIELPGIKIDGIKIDGTGVRSDLPSLPGLQQKFDFAGPKNDNTIPVANKVDGNIVAINPMTGRPEIQPLKFDANKVDTQAIVNKIDARIQQTQTEAGKVLQGRVEAQSNIPQLKIDVQSTRVAQTNDAVVRAARNEDVAAGRVQTNQTQLDGKGAVINAGNRVADGVRDGIRAEGNRADGIRAEGNIAGNRAINAGGRGEAQVGQPGVKAIGGRGEAIDGKAVVSDKAIRQISGGRYLTGVEIGMLIAAVGIAKARNDARTQAQKGDATVAGKEFNTCKGFLTEKASRINELTMNVRRFPGKEITVSAMLAITGAAGKQADAATGMRSLDYNVRIERTVGTPAGKTRKEDLIAAALFQNSDNDMEATAEAKKEEEPKQQQNLDTQMLGFLPSAALWRSRRRQEMEEEQNDDDRVSDAVSDDTSNTGITGFRRVIRVKANDTLFSIAEKEFQDANLAWLIADINFDRTTQHEMDGKRVVEVIKGQELQLPLESEIAEFYNRRAAYADPDNLITIVVENEINRDRLNEDLKDILGLARR